MSVDVPESTNPDAAYAGGDAERAHRAVEAAELGTWDWNAVTEAVRWDERLERQFGLEPGEFGGTVEAWVQLVWPADRDAAIAEFQRAVAARDGCYLEHRVLWPDGTVHWVAAQGGVRLDCDDRATGLAGLCWDITARRREQEQRELAHWRQQVLNRAGDLLTDSLAVAARLDTLAREVLSELADCGAIHLVDDEGGTWLVAAWHRDGSQEPAVRKLMRAGPHQPPGFTAQLSARTARVLTDPAELEWLDDLSVRSGYFVPLRRHDRTLGGVTFLRAEDNEWTEEDRNLGHQITRRLAVAVENTQLFNREQAARRLVVDLQRITAALAAAPSLADVARIVTADARVAVEADSAVLVQVLDGHLRILGAAGLDPAEQARWQDLSVDAGLPTARAVRAGVPLFDSGPDDVRAILPLTRGTRVLGAIAFAWPADRRVRVADREFLLSVAQQATFALDRAVLLAAEKAAREEAEESHRRMALLAEVSETLAASLDVDAVLAKLAHLVVPRLADQCTVDLVDTPGEPPRLLAVAAITPRLEELLHLTDSYLPRRRNPKTMIGRALATGQPVLAVQVSEEHLRRISVCEEQAQYYIDMELLSGLIVPLIARGQVLGALSMFTTRASGRVFDQETVALMTDLARRAALSVDNARLFTREHEAAETLQRSLLPDLPDLPDLDIAARYLPAAAHAGVGGDLFDVFALPDGATAIAIGDVMGHDMRAAAAMGQLRSVLRSYAWEGAAPAVVLDRMDQLVQSFEMAQLASALYARLEPGPDPDTRLLRYSNAGHLPPLLQHPDGTARFLEDGRSVLIGVPGGHPRGEGVEPVPRGSTLLLYTDGLLEIGRRPLDPGLAALLATVQAHDPAAGAESLCAAVLALGIAALGWWCGLWAVGAGQATLSVVSVHDHPADQDKVGALLRALADLAPTGTQHGSEAIPLDWFRWLPGAGPALFEPRAGRRRVQIPRDFGEFLAALDQVRLVPHALQVGWLFVAGRMLDSEGRMRRVFQPLVTVPVRVLRPPARWKPAELVAVGDVTLTELIVAADLRRSLERQLEGSPDGRDEPVAADWLHTFALAVAEAAGLPARRVATPDSTPEWFMRATGLVVVNGAGVFAPDEPQPSNRAVALREWAERAPARGTAFHAMYLGQPPSAEDHLPAPAPESPFLLTTAQRAAVAASRTDPVSVITGGPGTGKSHTVVAIACDALAAGRSVLVAARSDATVDALLDLFDRIPGPRPIVFGGAERRIALAAELASGGPPAIDAAGLGTTWAQLQAAIGRRDARRRERITRVEAHLVGTGSFDQARSRAPALFDGSVDLDAVDRLLDRAQAPVTGWRDRLRVRRSGRAARRLAGGPKGTTPTQLRHAAQAARALQVLRCEDVAPALESAGPYDELLRYEDEVRGWAGHWLAQASRAEDRMDRDARTSVSVLATALRSGRSARREQLTRLDTPLTRALPLWVGSLPDIEDLLPPVPALFDLVVLDEASSVDQTLAVPALLRGRRAVVVGDPMQLRQVSFLRDGQLAVVVERHGLRADPLLAATIDVRRNSAFDVAAGAAKVRTLDEHFRCAPHLIDFVGARIYGGAFTVATRSPLNERCDCIDVSFRAGTRDRRGAVMSEVERVIATLQDLEAAGQRSVGVVTPFRAHADAIEEATLAAFTVDELERLDLRVGTVHAFQGNERDVIVLALGIGTGEAAGSWRFVEDPHLFAVLMTRARRRLIILQSATPPAVGLLHDYLAQADCPIGRPGPAGHLSGYAEGLADDLAAAGLDVARAYPTGRHVVDIAIGGGNTPVAVICGIHRDGPLAHVDRHLALRRSGWEVVEALPEGWGARRSQLVVELVGRLRAPSRV